MTVWPSTAADLEAEQLRLGAAHPPPWTPPDGRCAVGGCFVCFPRGAHGSGAAGDAAWAAAVVLRGGQKVACAVVEDRAGAPYAPGLLGLREGPALGAAIRALDELPDVLLVNATGRDHPRRCGLALHLGALLSVPSIGVTHRLLVAGGVWPADTGAGALSPIRLEGETIGYWLRTRARARPLAVHAGWRVSPAQAVEIVQGATGHARTPEPLRQARRLARAARAKATGRV